MEVLIIVKKSIYLKVPASILYGRLKKNKGKRPLLARLSDKELEQFVKRELEKRERYYEQASIIFNCKEKPKASDLIKALSLDLD